MYKNENSEITKGQLIGALIGLARATEGNVNRPTDETDRVFVKAMQISLSDCSCQKICNQIELLHEEKRKLVPRCQKCASPCGRNSDFDITGLNRMKNSQLKYVLLSGLLYMASFSAVSNENSSVGREIMGFFYKAFFFVGYDCDEESLLPLFRELGEWQSKLYSQYFQPESDG
jgi:hypothetical protein